jgi:hypothetical protein
MVASVQAQIQSREREKRLSELTNKELSALQPETVTYKSVGKMYGSFSLFLPDSSHQPFFSCLTAFSDTRNVQGTPFLY